jgi:phosphatidylinositol glycan class V
MGNVSHVGLLKTFCAFKAVNIALIFSAAAVHPFSDSTSLLFSIKERSTRLLQPFVRWDAVYYFLIARDGYVHEKMHAFYPLYPFLIRLFASMLPFRKDLSVLLSGILISNLCHLLGFFCLYHLTLQIFKNKALAHRSAVLFLVQPASYHMTTLFSESSFAALALFGMFCFTKGFDLIAALSFSLSGLTRSNGILLAGFYLYRAIFSFRSMRNFGKDIMHAMISSFGGILYLYSCYRKYCFSDEKAEWCYRTIPNVYSHVQAKYWNVGAFKYYTLSQIPNFLIASPMIALSIYGLYSNSNILLFRTKQRLLIPYYFLWLALFLFSLVFVHIQVINRLFSFLPPVFWTMSQLYRKSNQFQRRVYIIIMGIYYSSIPFMIACFYPPA